jgi:hypothetical protein
MGLAACMEIIPTRETLISGVYMNAPLTEDC